MLSRITGRTVADEARQPSEDVVMRAKDQRWNWLGHIAHEWKAPTYPTIPTTMNQTKPQDLSFSGVSGLEIQAAAANFIRGLCRKQYNKMQYNI